MIRFSTLFYCCLILLSCADGGETATARSPSLAGRTDPATTEPQCRSVWQPPVDAGAATVVLDALRTARQDDERCGAPSAGRRRCRALYAIASLDPAHHLGDPEMLDATARAIEWVAADGSVTSDSAALSEAFDAVAERARRLRTAGDDAERSTIIVDGLSPAELVRLDEAWSECDAISATG